MKEKTENEADQEIIFISEFPNTRQFICKNLCSINNLLHCTVLCCFMVMEKRE